MRTIVIITLFSCIGASASATNNVTLAQALIRTYEQIDTVSCEIRKTTRSKSNTVRMLSRVYYKRPDYIHVDNVSPSKRTIIADGKALYYYEEGLPLGFSRPIADLSEIWLKSLRNVPGTPLEHLHNLRDLPEVEIPPIDNEPVRRGYQTKGVFVVLSCDSEGRLVGVRFFETRAMRERIAEYTYAAFQQVSTDCWIPCLHRGALLLSDGTRVEEVRRISNLTVNLAIAERMFDAGVFLKNVSFVDDFEKTLE